MHTIRIKPDNQKLLPGEQCNFFGCFLRTIIEEGNAKNCTKIVRGDFINETVTIGK